MNYRSLGSAVAAPSLLSSNLLAVAKAATSSVPADGPEGLRTTLVKGDRVLVDDIKGIYQNMPDLQPQQVPPNGWYRDAAYIRCGGPQPRGDGTFASANEKIGAVDKYWATKNSTTVSPYGAAGLAPGTPVPPPLFWEDPVFRRRGFDKGPTSLDCATNVKGYSNALAKQRTVDEFWTNTHTGITTDPRLSPAQREANRYRPLSDGANLPEVLAAFGAQGAALKRQVHELNAQGKPVKVRMKGPEGSVRGFPEVDHLEYEVPCTKESFVQYIIRPDIYETGRKILKALLALPLPTTQNIGSGQIRRDWSAIVYDVVTSMANAMNTPSYFALGGLPYKPDGFKLAQQILKSDKDGSGFAADRKLLRIPPPTTCAFQRGESWSVWRDFPSPDDKPWQLNKDMMEWVRKNDFTGNGGNYGPQEMWQSQRACFYEVCISARTFFGDLEELRCPVAVSAWDTTFELREGMTKNAQGFDVHTGVFSYVPARVGFGIDKLIANPVQGVLLDSTNRTVAVGGANDAAFNQQTRNVFTYITRYLQLRNAKRFFVGQAGHVKGTLVDINDPSLTVWAATGETVEAYIVKEAARTYSTVDLARVGAENMAFGLALVKAQVPSGTAMLAYYKGLAELYAGLDAGEYVTKVAKENYADHLKTYPPEVTGKAIADIVRMSTEGAVQTWKTGIQAGGAAVGLALTATGVGAVAAGVVAIVTAIASELVGPIIQELPPTPPSIPRTPYVRRIKGACALEDKDIFNPPANLTAAPGIPWGTLGIIAAVGVGGIAAIKIIKSRKAAKPNRRKRTSRRPG